MKASTVIKSLFNWFANCEVLNKDSELNVEYLGDEATQYSIEVVPCSPILKQYADGSMYCQYIFNFASRELYGEDAQLNIENLEFFERLEEWIAEQNVNNHLPKLPDNCTTQSINVLSSGYIMDNDTKTARYQIQCRLKYIKTMEV